MFRNKILILTTVITFFLIGCAHLPTGPSIMALPAAGKNFDEFRADDKDCREYASTQLDGKSPQYSFNSSGIQSAAIGAGIGAGAGAAFGGGAGAAIGAGAGLLAGALFGRGSASTSGNIMQQRYDNGYTQCMYAKGHRVPVSGNITAPSNIRSRESNVIHNSPASSPNFIPPAPPTGNPPPPPPQ